MLDEAAGVTDPQRAPCRVVIADDHTLLRQSLVKLVEGEPGLVVVADVNRGDHVLPAVRRSQAGMVMLDISMPGMDGLTAAEELRREVPDVRIVFLTMHDDDFSVRRALSLRADGYLVKTAGMDEVLDALQYVADGGTYLSPTVSHRVAAMVTPGRRSATDQLTEREREVIRLLADGYRPGDMADELVLSVKTVRNHLTNIYSKLQVGSAHQAVVEAHRRGIVASA